MKKHFFLLIALLFSFPGFSQSCLPEGITFSTQVQIDSFQVDYPGCTEIEGDVTISGSDITNLNGLNVITAFHGILTISDNGALTNLTGLENVTSIGGQFSTNHFTLIISDNDELIDLAGLNSLVSLSGGLHLLYNQALTSLTGLDSLNSIGGDLSVEDNWDLTSLTGLEGLSSIGGSLLTDGNTHIESLAALAGLTSISGDLTIRSSHGITNLAGLEGLTFITGNVNISNNFDLIDLTGLDNVTFIGGTLMIGEIAGVTNLSLTSLTGLNNVTSIGKNLLIYANPALSSLDGLNNVSSIGGYISIIMNDTLTNLTGLEGLISLGGRLQIYENKELTSLTGLDNINAGTITDLLIHNNISLSTCDVQSICEYLASPNGAVTIYNNASGCKNAPEISDACGFTLHCLPYGNYYFLTQSDIDSFNSDYSGCTELMGNVYISGEDITNLYGLSMVTYIGKRLWIEQNNNLTSLAGLDALTQVGYHLWIEGNNALMNLTGLENLTQIGGYITIKDNISMTSLSGIDNVEAGSVSDVSIRENSSLSYCEVKSICEFLTTPGLSIHFQQNATGCNSIDEVFNACTVGLNESNIPENFFSISPNPSSTRIIIKTTALPSKFQLSIFNLNGQEVVRRQITETTTVIDISDLPGGVYFVRLTGEGSVSVEKFVKID